MKRITSVSIAAPIALLLLAAAPKVFSDDHDKKTDVTITEPIEVPGAVLQPGTYMFILLNSSSDRNIVEIKSEDGSHLYSMSFATAAARVTRTGNTVLTFYEMPQGAPRAVREWFWPGDYEGQAFLYPHDEAARIAAASNQKVPELTDQEAATVNAQAPAAPVASLGSGDQTAAVAPAAQPAPPADDSTQQIADQPVQPAVQEPAPQVEVAQAAPPPVDNSSSNDLLAQNTPPTQNYAPAPAPQTTTSDDASDSLPKTASDLPLIGLVGLVALASAAMLRLTGRGRA